MSFDKFQDIHQSTPNSCGAFALAAALEDLGLADITKVLNTVDLTQGYTKLSPKAYAQRIYQVTGNLMKGEETALYNTDSPAMHQSPPSALAHMASEYGIHTSNITVCYNNVAKDYFSRSMVAFQDPPISLFEAEVQLITKQSVRLIGPEEYSHFPENNQVHLLGVNNNQHWIAINYNTCYDPGKGTVCLYSREQRLPLQKLETLGGEYEFSGWWISLQRN